MRFIRVNKQSGGYSTREVVYDLIKLQRQPHQKLRFRGVEVGDG